MHLKPQAQKNVETLMHYRVLSFLSELNRELINQRLNVLV